MKIKSSLLAASAFFSLCALPATAALTTLYSTNFNSPTYSDGGLIGQDGWAITQTSVVNPISVANTATNGNVTLATSGQDVNRIFSPAVTSGSVFVSATITVGTAQATGDYFLHLGDAGSSNFYARLYVKASGAGYAMALGTSSGTTGLVYGAEQPFSTAQTILLRYDFVTGLANDTGALFVNPTTEDGSGDTAYVAATLTGTDAASISSIRLRQGSATAAPTVTIDNLSVAIPEPSVALIGGLGLLGLLRRRRCC